VARKKAELECPNCLVSGMWSSTRERDAKTLKRSYRCDNCRYEYDTVERIVRSKPDAYVLDPFAEIPKPFDDQFIGDHLRRHLKKLLTADQRTRVAALSAIQLEASMETLQPIRDPAYRDQVGTTPVFSSKEVRSVVQTALKRARHEVDPELSEQYKAAEALYALTERNIELSAFAKWLNDYFGMRTNLPRPPKRTNVEPETWQPPSRPISAPKTVVKNFRETIAVTSDENPTQVAAEDRAATRPRREHVAFNSDQFLESIENAVGRELHGQRLRSARTLARFVHAWVLASCHGQTVVRSSQLAAYTAGVLRRCAPVAYLRWTLLGKELQVREIFEETRGLIENPSSKLLFYSPTDPLGLSSPTAPAS
jgi:transcriptional regulator NrdR family protein